MVSGIGLAALLAGCSTFPDQQYWGRNGLYKKQQPHDYKPTAYSKNIYVIEFKKDGSPWDQEQIALVEKSIHESNLPPLMVLFVHGWKNNASQDNGNLKAFNAIIAQLSDQNKYRNRSLIGVYLGWPGDPLFIDPTHEPVAGDEGQLSLAHSAIYSAPQVLSRQLSIFSKKKTADDIAQNKEFIATVQTLSSLAKARNGHSIAVGHSLGGRILEYALIESPELAEENLLTVIINPASSLSRAIKLREKLKTPLAIVNLASRNDGPVKYINPYTEWPVAAQDARGNHSAAGYNVKIVTHYLDEGADLLKMLTVSREDFIENHMELRYRYNPHAREYGRKKEVTERALHNSVFHNPILRLSIDGHGEASQKEKHARTGLIKSLESEFSKVKGITQIPLRATPYPVGILHFEVPTCNSIEIKPRKVIIADIGTGIKFNETPYPIISASPNFIDGHNGQIFTESTAAIIAEIFNMRFNPSQFD